MIVNASIRMKPFAPKGAPRLRSSGGGIGEKQISQRKERVKKGLNQA
ncbi:MAG: hypothetical protein ACMUEL_01525 [Flavobacteriales bacterium Tduv]